jgi:hypothetical protein
MAGNNPLLNPHIVYGVVSLFLLYRKSTFRVLDFENPSNFEEEPLKEIIKNKRKMCLIATSIEVKHGV